MTSDLPLFDREGCLLGNLVIRVDNEDKDLLSKYRWYLAQYNDEILPCATVFKKGSASHVWMHQLICKKYAVPYFALRSHRSAGSGGIDLRKANIQIVQEIEDKNKNVQAVQEDEEEIFDDEIVWASSPDRTE